MNKMMTSQSPAKLSAAPTVRGGSGSHCGLCGQVGGYD
jgi:hypothetical protein